MTVKVSLFRRDGNYYLQFLDPASGKKVRKSAQTRQRRDALRKAIEWENEVNAKFGKVVGKMYWDEFRLRLEREKLPTMRDASQRKTITVLDIYEREMRPKYLLDVTPQSLSTFRSRLTCAPATVQGYLGYMSLVLNWAHEIGLIKAVPKPPRVKSPPGKMKGRPIAREAFERMLEHVPKITRDPEEWTFLLEGLWRSGLRLQEVLKLHWTDTSTICIVDIDGRYPMFSIPGDHQKSTRNQLAPTTPDFVELLRAHPRRTGRVFRPIGHRKPYTSVNAIGLKIVKLGALANVTVAENKFAGRMISDGHSRTVGPNWCCRSY